MILNWTKDNLKVIPLLDVPKPGEPVVAASEYVTLAPGYNEVPDNLWKIARMWVTPEIESGKIVEEWQKVPRPEKSSDLPILYLDAEDGKATQTIRVPADLRDISRPRIQDVIKNTFIAPVLKKWSTEDTRPDVQSAILKQIEAIEKGQITG